MTLFYLFAPSAVIASLLVIAQRIRLQRAPVDCVVSARSQGWYVLLDAPFRRGHEIHVYAGAIMVLFLIVVIL